MTSTPPSEPSEYDSWLDELQRQWQAGKIPDPQAVSVIVVNTLNQVLLQQRDSDPHLAFPGLWTLPGGVVEGNETPEQGAYRELAEETGLEVHLSLWKVYRRRHHSRDFYIAQFVYIARSNVDAHDLTLGEGQALGYFGRDQINSLPIAFGFEALLHEFFLSTGTAPSL